MEHTKAYQEFKKNGNTKFVRYSEGAEMYHMSVSTMMSIRSRPSITLSCIAHSMARDMMRAGWSIIAI